MRSVGWLLLILFPILATAPSYGQAEADEVVATRLFSDLQNAWKPLDGGFLYKGRTNYKIFVYAPQAGSVPGKVARLEKYQPPVEETASLFVRVIGARHRVKMTLTNGQVRDVQADDGRIAKLHPDGQPELIDSRSSANEDGFLRAPIFTPSYVMEQWIGYPVPGREVPRGTYTTTVKRVSDVEIHVDVRNSWTNEGDSRAYSRTRNNVFRRHSELGWVLEEVHVLNQQGQVLREELIDWSAFSTRQGTVPIPSRLVHRDYLRDPSTAAQVPNSESSYEIDMSTMALKDETSDQTEWQDVREISDRIKEGADVAINPGLAMRPYLLSFVFILIVAVALWTRSRLGRSQRGR